MWQSTLITAPSVGSVRTNAIGGFSHSNSDFPHLHSKVHNRKTLASYRLPENFRSIALYPKSSATSLFGSSFTDRPVTDNGKGFVIDDENGNNDSLITRNWIKREEDMSSLLDLLFRSVPDLNFKLRNMKSNLDEELVRKVLENPFVPRENLIDFFWWAAGCDSRIVTQRFLQQLIWRVSVDPERNTAYSLWGFLRSMLDDSAVMTTEMLNQQISLFSELGQGMAAYDVFHHFGKLGCARNADSYYLTIKALCERSVFDVAGLVCERMISEDVLPEGDEEVGSIICYFCQGGMVKEALSVYKSAREKEIYVPPSSLRRLVSFLSTRKNEDDDDAYLNLAVEMLHETDYIWLD